MIHIHFDKLYRYDRVQEPCFLAVPFKKGVLYDKDKIVIASGSHETDFQAKVTGRWDDGSIRWLFTRFQADIPANGTAEYKLFLDRNEFMKRDAAGSGQMLGGEYVEDVLENSGIAALNQSHAPASRTGSGNPDIVTINPDGSLTADTGCLKVELRSGTDGLFYSAAANGIELAADDITGPILKDGNNKEYSPSIERWDIIENGSVCAVVRGFGKQKAEDGEERTLEATMTFFRGKEWMDLAYRIFHDAEESFHIKSLVMKVKNPYAGKHTRTCAAASNYRTFYTIGEDGECVERVIDANYLMFESNEHMSEVMYGTFFAACQSEEGGVCVTIFQAQQNYPKAVRADKDG